MRCLLCFMTIEEDVRWHTLFQSKTYQYCDACRPHLKKITGPICESCGRPQTTNKLCPDCVKRPHALRVYNRALYYYDAPMQKLLATCKYRHHYHALAPLKQTVNQSFLTYYKSVKHITLIPIPVSNERMEERLFNQAAVIAHMINRPVFHGLKRVHQEKQAKKNRKERLNTANPFYLAPHITLPKGPVVLIDDVYTTGTTIHHAANVLHKAGIGAIYSFTLAR